MASRDGIAQKTDYPWDGAVAFAVEPETPAEFTLRLRVPGWCRSANSRSMARTSTSKAVTDAAMRHSADAGSGRHGYADARHAGRAHLRASRRARRPGPRGAEARPDRLLRRSSRHVGAAASPQRCRATRAITSSLEPDLLGGVATLSGDGRGTCGRQSDRSIEPSRAVEHVPFKRRALSRLGSSRARRDGGLAAGDLTRRTTIRSRGRTNMTRSRFFAIH